MQQPVFAMASFDSLQYHFFGDEGVLLGTAATLSVGRTLLGVAARRGNP